MSRFSFDFGSKKLTQTQIEIVNILKTLTESPSADEQKKQLHRSGLDGYLINTVKAALVHYRVGDHTSPFNRFYRAHFTKENGPQYAFDHFDIDTIDTALEVIKEVIKHVKDDPENARIHSNSRIYHLLQQMEVTISLLVSHITKGTNQACL